MKKLLSLLLVLMMLLGGAAFAEAADYVGYWVLTGAEVAGVRVDPAMAGLSSYMELCEDGRYQVVMADDCQSGTWAVSANGIDIESAGIVVSFVLVDDALILEMEGDKLIYTRGTSPVPLSGLAVEDFNGDWVCTFLEVDGKTYAAASLGADLTLHIADGKGHVKMGSPAGAEEFDAICTVKESDDYGTVMYFDFLENGKPCGDGMMLFMYDSGELVWFDTYDGHEMLYCFVPAE